MRSLAFVSALALFLLPLGAAQVPSALFLTDDATQVTGFDDVRLLDPATPTGESTTMTLTPATEDPGPVHWASAPVADDLEITGSVTIDLYFDNSADVASTTTVTLSAVDGNGTASEIGQDSDDTPAQAVAHQETFTIDAEGTVLLAGDVLVMTIEVTGGAVSVALLYGGEDVPSGVSDLPAGVLDSDGDGFGDSEERRAGSDPGDPDDTPGQDTGEDNGTADDDTNQTAPPDDDGSGGDGAGDDGAGAAEGDAPPAEALLASFFMLTCLALAGSALLRRFPHAD